MVVLQREVQKISKGDTYSPRKEKLHMPEMKKSEVDALIHKDGIALINTDALTKIAGNAFIGVSTAMPGRYFEIKVTAKNTDFNEDSLKAILADNEFVAKNKQVKADAAAKKKQADAEKREKAKAEKEAKKTANSADKTAQ